MDATSGPTNSTLPDLPDIGTERRNHLIRATALTIVAVFVLAGLAGAYGVHSSHVGGGSPGGCGPT